MKKSAESDQLSRPPLEVKLPVVTLQLKDLSYLRSLAQPKSVRCNPDRGVSDRLRFLDLIARAKIQKSKSELATVAKRLTSLRRQLDQQVKREDWNEVANVAYQIRTAARSGDAIEDDVLTDAGRALLKSGVAQVRARKVGCIK